MRNQFIRTFDSKRGNGFSDSMKSVNRTYIQLTHNVSLFLSYFYAIQEVSAQCSRICDYELTRIMKETDKVVYSLVYARRVKNSKRTKQRRRKKYFHMHLSDCEMRAECEPFVVALSANDARSCHLKR